MTLSDTRPQLQPQFRRLKHEAECPRETQAAEQDARLRNRHPTSARHGPEVPLSDGLSFHSDSAVFAEERRAHGATGAVAGSREMVRGQLPGRPPSPQRSRGSGPDADARDRPHPIAWEPVRNGGCSAPTPEVLNQTLGVCAC